MSADLVVAWRNVLRNRRRTFVTAATVVVSLAVALFLWSIIDGNNRQSIAAATSYLSGHLQIAGRGFFDGEGFDAAIEDPAEAAAILRADEGVGAFAAKVDAPALLSFGEQTLGIGVVGLDVAAEPPATRLASAIEQGRPLRAGDGAVILVSAFTAEHLGARLGDEVVLTSDAADGSMAGGRYEIVGIFDTGNHDVDGAFCILPLRAAQELFALGDAVTGFIVQARAGTDGNDTARRLRGALPAAYEMRTWQELLPSVAQAVRLHEVFSYLLLVVVLVLVAIGVTNTMLMAVVERTPEWGLLLALGSTPARLIRLVLLEGLLLSGLCLPAGFLMALGPVLYFARYGFDLSVFHRGLESLPGHVVVIHPQLTPAAVLVTMALVALVGLMATLYPALRILDLTPTEALRGLEGKAAPRRMSEATGGGSGPRGVFLHIAWRNLARNTRRSLLIGAASALGVAAMVFVHALMDGFFFQIVDNSTRFLSGHVQVGQAGFRKRGLTAADAVLDPALASRLEVPGAKARVTWRVQSEAMVSTAEGSSPVMMFGIDPEREPLVTSLSEEIGRGQALGPGDDEGMVLGARLAERLKVTPGSKVVLTAQGRDNELGSAAYRVRGVFETGSESLDDRLVFVSCRAAQELMRLGDRVSMFVVRLEDREAVPGYVQALEPRLPASLEAASWEQIMPQSEDVLELTQAVFGIILTLAFTVTALGGMNAILMSVMERRREIGTLLALGTAPGQVVRLVVYEATALILTGALVGLAAGGLLSLYFGAHGIDLAAWTRAVSRIAGMTSTIYPRLTLANVAATVLGLLVINVLTALYPAWLAARLDPVQNLRP